MDFKEFNYTHRTNFGDWLITKQALTVGLWIAAFGILRQVVTGAIGVFTTPGTAYRLRHSDEVGPSIGLATTVALFRSKRSRHVPKG